MTLSSVENDQVATEAGEHFATSFGDKYVVDNPSTQLFFAKEDGRLDGDDHAGLQRVGT